MHCLHAGLILTAQPCTWTIAEVIVNLECPAILEEALRMAAKFNGSFAIPALGSVLMALTTFQSPSCKPWQPCRRHQGASRARQVDQSLSESRRASTACMQA